MSLSWSSHGPWRLPLWILVALAFLAAGLAGWGWLTLQRHNQAAEMALETLAGHQARQVAIILDRQIQRSRMVAGWITEILGTGAVGDRRIGAMLARQAARLGPDFDGFVLLDPSGIVLADTADEGADWLRAWHDIAQAVEHLRRTGAAYFGAPVRRGAGRIGIPLFEPVHDADGALTHVLLSWVALDGLETFLESTTPATVTALLLTRNDRLATASQPGLVRRNLRRPGSALTDPAADLTHRAAVPALPFTILVRQSRAAVLDSGLGIIAREAAIAAAVISISGIILLWIARLRQHLRHQMLEREIEARRESERALVAAKLAAERASAAKTEFLANVSHELRTPLNGILGTATLIGDDDLPPDQRTQLDTLVDCAQNLLVLIDDILDLSRIEVGRLELVDQDFDLRDLLDNLRRLMTPQAAARGLNLTVTVDDRVPARLSGDAVRLRQILLNLLGNAVKFTRQGAVTVEAALRAGDGGALWLRIAVIDTGCGIDPDFLPRLFEPFTQSRPAEGGSGLGLAISRRLIEAMDGTVMVDSQPGVGSRFTLDLPVRTATPAGSGSEAATAPAPAPARLDHLTVVLAEDDAVSRAFMTEMLHRAGARVHAAGTGAEAVALVDTHRPDLVLMDIRLPDMDGLEATRRIRDLPAPAGQVPILAVTANVMAEDRDRYRAAGMDDVIAKPVDRAALFARLRELIPVGDDGEPSPTGRPRRWAATPVAEAKDHRPDLRALFDQVAPGYLNQAVEALARDDIAGAADHLHTLASAAATMGLTALAADCREAESIARRESPAPEDLAARVATIRERHVGALSG